MNGKNKNEIQQGKQVLSQSDAEKNLTSLTDINVIGIAERVYRLMQRDLILERDRNRKLGG